MPRVLWLIIGIWPVCSAAIATYAWRAVAPSRVMRLPINLPSGSPRLTRSLALIAYVVITTALSAGGVFVAQTGVRDSFLAIVGLGALLPAPVLIAQALETRRAVRDDIGGVDQLNDPRRLDPRTLGPGGRVE